MLIIYLSLLTTSMNLRLQRGNISAFDGQVVSLSALSIFAADFSFVLDHLLNFLSHIASAL